MSQTTYNEQVPKYSETPQDIIVRVANEVGVPPELALAIAQQESGFNPNIIGDNGHSVGLFQLNDGGEGAGMSVQQRQDPETNARIALTQVANVLKAHPDWSYGEIAAAAQRPQDRAGYANAINAIVGKGVTTPRGVTYSSLNAQATPSGAPVLDEQSLAAEYGFAAAFFNSDPELQNLIQQAVGQQWTPQQFQAKFQATKWYQSHSQSARDFIALQTSDPTTFNQKLNQEIADIKASAVQLGATLDDNTLKQIATNALMFGWDSTQIQQAVGVHVSLTSGGQSADNLTTMKQYLANMGIKMADQTLQSNLQGIESGSSTMGDFQSQVRKLAASAFPAYADQINAGQSVKDIVDPYIQDMASILEINPNQITLDDPTIRKVLTGGSNNGQPAQVGLWQFEQQLRQDPRWQYTKNATDEAYSMIRTIGQQWGFLS